MLIHTKTNLITPLIFLLLLHSTQLTQAQPSSPGSNTNPNYGAGSVSPTMGVIIIVLIAALFFMGFFSIYIRHCSDDSSTTGATIRRGIGSIRRSRRAPRGLEAEVIQSFPTFDYAAVKSAKIGKGALECAVCLTEFEDDDTLRLIPKCDHVFHPDCIDTWLVGHTTCPVCRCNLADGNSPVEDQNDHRQPNEIVVVNVDDGETIDDDDHRHPNNENTDNESIEQPLHGRFSRNRTMRNLSFGRPRLWFGNKYSRSYSTGHVAVKQWENMERFTLRLPEDLRKQIMSGKLERSTSLVVLPRESSSRRGYRTGGFGEGSSRPNRLGGSVRGDRTGRSDRWVFTLAPPFITRAPSLKSPNNKVGPISPNSRGGSLRVKENVNNVNAINRDGSLRGAMQAEMTQLPV